jgi:hypothetical protein
MYTPWGKADHVRDIGRGIKRVDTPSHGGYFVPEKECAKMHHSARVTCAGPCWYEEDAWCLVALSFPDLFPPDAAEMARETCRNWMRPEQCAAFGLEPSERNIYLEEIRRQEALDAGKRLRCSAMNVDWLDRKNPGLVHVLFRDKAGKMFGYYMKQETYRAIPLMAIATPEDFARIEGAPLEPAPTEFHYQTT